MSPASLDPSTLNRQTMEYYEDKILEEITAMGMEPRDLVGNLPNLRNLRGFETVALWRRIEDLGGGPKFIPFIDPLYRP